MKENSLHSGSLASTTRVAISFICLCRRVCWSVRLSYCMLVYLTACARMSVCLSVCLPFIQDRQI